MSITPEGEFGEATIDLASILSSANNTRQGGMPIVLPVIGSLTHESRAISIQLFTDKITTTPGHFYSFKSQVLFSVKVLPKIVWPP